MTSVTSVCLTHRNERQMTLQCLSSCFWGFSHSMREWHETFFIPLSRVTHLDGNLVQMKKRTGMRWHLTNRTIHLSKCNNWFARQKGKKIHEFVYEKKIALLLVAERHLAVSGSTTPRLRSVFVVPAVNVGARVPICRTQNNNSFFETQKWWHVEVSNFQIDYTEKKSKGGENPHIKYTANEIYTSCFSVVIWLIATFRANRKACSSRRFNHKKWMNLRPDESATREPIKIKFETDTKSQRKEEKKLCEFCHTG